MFGKCNNDLSAAGAAGAAGAAVPQVLLSRCLGVWVLGCSDADCGIENQQPQLIVQIGQAAMSEIRRSDADSAGRAWAALAGGARRQAPGSRLPSSRTWLASRRHWRLVVDPRRRLDRRNRQPRRPVPMPPSHLRRKPLDRCHRLDRWTRFSAHCSGGLSIEPRAGAMAGHRRPHPADGQRHRSSVAGAVSGAGRCGSQTRAAPSARRG